MLAADKKNDSIIVNNMMKLICMAAGENHLFNHKWRLKPQYPS